MNKYMIYVGNCFMWFAVEHGLEACCRTHTF